MMTTHPTRSPIQQLEFQFDRFLKAAERVASRPPVNRRRREKVQRWVQLEFVFVKWLQEPVDGVETREAVPRPAPVAKLPERKLSQLEIYRDRMLELIEEQEAITGTHLADILGLPQASKGTKLLRQLQNDLTLRRRRRRLRNQRIGNEVWWHIITKEPVSH